jgi:hypothetical protein
MVVWVGSIAAGLASTVILGPESRGTYDHVFVSEGPAGNGRTSEKLFYRKGEGESNDYVTGKQNERKYNEGERKE